MPRQAAIAMPIIVMPTTGMPTTPCPATCHVHHRAIAIAIAIATIADSDSRHRRRHGLGYQAMPSRLPWPILIPAVAQTTDSPHPVMPCHAIAIAIAMAIADSESGGQQTRTRPSFKVRALAVNAAGPVIRCLLAVKFTFRLHS